MCAPLHLSCFKRKKKFRGTDSYRLREDVRRTVRSFVRVQIDFQCEP